MDRKTLQALFLLALAGEQPRTSTLKEDDVSYLDRLFLNPITKVLEPQPAKIYATIDPEHLRVWCHFRGFYNLPTTELVDWVRNKIGGRSAIEIGAGHGALGRALGIPTTDSRLQEDPKIKAEFYDGAGQPAVKYPDDIIKMDAAQAIAHYKPQVVVASWVTQIFREEERQLGGNMYGVDEEAILEQVDTYIFVGNLGPHANKRIRKKQHEFHSFTWLYGRGDRSRDVIFVWNK